MITKHLDNAIYHLDKAAEELFQARVSRKNEVPDKFMASLIGMTDAVKGIVIVIGSIRRVRMEEE